MSDISDLKTLLYQHQGLLQEILPADQDLSQQIDAHKHVKISDLSPAVSLSFQAYQLSSAGISPYVPACKIICQVLSHFCKSSDQHSSPLSTLFFISAIRSSIWPRLPYRYFRINSPVGLIICSAICELTFLQTTGCCSCKITRFTFCRNSSKEEAGYQGRRGA